MKKYLLTFVFFATLIFNACAQKKETFDLVNYTAPTGWSKTSKPETLTFSKESGSNFCMITIYKSIDATDNAPTNFDMAWKSLVQENLGVTAKATMQPSSTDNGWETKLGSAPFEKDGIKGAAILISSSQNSKLVNILAVTNTSVFQNEMETFLDGIDLKTATKEAGTTNNITSAEAVTNKKEAIPTSLSSKYQNGTGVLSDYKFIVPPSFVGTTYSNEIQFAVNKIYGKYTISMLPLKPYSGDIETDFLNIYQNEFKDWQIYPIRSDYATDDENEKGVTCQGFPYVMGRKLLLQDINNYYGPKIEGLLLLIKVGNKLATIVASQPFQNGRSDAGAALNYLLFTLRFNNVALPPANNLLQQIEGSWFYANSNLGISTNYNKNGTFNNVGTSQRTVGHDAYYDKVITTNFSADGTFKLTGNELTKNFKENGKISKSLIRFYYTIYNSEGYKIKGWQYKMQILDPNSKCDEPCVPQGTEFKKEN